ncbi:MAG: CHAT domain-containing protein [Pseudomonadota bacterium]|nr:CHAT domain-containing protein [Pseudomonadota bacterium]
MPGTTLFSTKARIALGTVISLGGMVACPPMAAAQEQPVDAVEDKLETMRRDAMDLFARTTANAEGSRKVLDAWIDLENAARSADADHRLIGYAQIKKASQLYRLGENIEAQAQVEAGLATLPDGGTPFLLVRGEGVALLGTILAQAGKAEDAISALRSGYADFMESFEQLPETEITRDAAMSKSNLEFSLSQVLLRLSETEEALAFQKASLDTREQAFGPNDPDTIGSYYGYAGALRRAGKVKEAEANARIAVSRAIDHVDPSHVSYARALEMLAIVLSRSGRPIEATDYLTRALELKRQHEGAESLFFGYGIHQLGTIFHQRGRFDQSVPLFTEAAPLFAKYQGEESPFGLGSLAYAGQGEFALGKTQAAVDRLGGLFDRLGEQSRELLILERIGPDYARGLKRLGRTQEARRVADSLIARQVAATGNAAFPLRHMRLVQAWVGEDTDLQAERARSMIEYLARDSQADLGEFLLAEKRAALDLVMEIAVARDDADLLASAMALSSVSGISRATQLQRERAAAADKELASAIRDLQNADEALDAADRALIVALANTKGIEEAREALQSADAARQAALEALEKDHAGWKVSTFQTSADIASIRAQLADGEAFLALVPGYDGAYSLLVTQEDVQARRLSAPRAQLVELAARLRQSAAGGAFDEGAAVALGEALFPEHVRDALSGVQVLKVLAGGPFASLPLGLIDLNDVDDEPQWLMDRHALVNVVSFDFTGGGDAAADAASDSFVAFAAPAGFGKAGGDTGANDPLRSLASYFAREGADAAALAALPPLPQAAREAREIAGSFAPSRRVVFAGADANEANLVDSRVASADVLLFATHGLVGGEVEGIAEPALVLSPGSGDGLLTASEIARLDLSASWVILTACDSAAGLSGGLPAFSGLARAFRFAGGQSLLATHWKVRDDAAAYVAVEAVAHYRKHKDKARALQHAVQSLRRESGIPGAQRPDMWGPFVLVE